MADLRIADAPELDESEVQGGLKLPTGGFGNKAINMNTVANWVVKDKDLPSKDYVDDKFNQGNQGLAGHVANKNNPHEVTKEQIGLGNVDNTADADKPISNATSAALNLKADKSQLQGLATTAQLDLKADKSTTYTKTEVDGVVDDLYQSLEDNFVANGAALPYDPQVTYNDGAIVNDAGVLKKVVSGQLELAVKDTDVKVGDTTLDVALTRVGTKAIKFLDAKEIGLVHYDEQPKPPYTTQQYLDAYNNAINFSQAVKQANDDGYSEVVLERGQYPLVYTNESGGTFSQGIIGQLKFHYLTNLTINYNGSTLFVLFDSNNKNPYDKNTTLQPYQLFGCIGETRHVKNITFANGLFVGDEYTRAWVTGESKTEQTSGMRHYINSVGVHYKNMKFTGFRGDGISGRPLGERITYLNDWYKGSIDILGTDIELVGAYRTGRIDIRESEIFNNSVQLMSSGYLRAARFRNDLLSVAFYRENGTQINQTYCSQADNIELPKDTAFIQFVAYDDERTDDVVSYGTASTGYYVGLWTGCVYDIFVEDDCEFYDIHRGGIAGAGLTISVGKAKFRNLGRYSKMGFPDYGDFTQYGINIEDTYCSRLVVDGAEFDGIRQGVLANLRKFQTLNCTFKNIEVTGVMSYGCAFSEVKNNTFDRVGKAFDVMQNQNPYTQKQYEASGNILRNTTVSFNCNNFPKFNAVISNNQAFNSRFTVHGNKNVDVIGNTLLDINGRVVETGVVRGGRIVSNNIFGMTNTNYESRDWAILGVFDCLSASNNTFIVTKADQRLIRITMEGEKSGYAGLNIQSDGKTLIGSLTDKSNGWTNHTDKFNFEKSVLDNINHRFSGLDGQNRYNTEILYDGCDFKNSSYIALNKRESASYAASTTKITFKNCNFDLTSSTLLVQTVYTLLDSCEITFLNCTFISDTEKTIKFVQAGSDATTANITSKLIGCKLVNVINDDGITTDDSVVIETPETPPKTTP